MRWFDEYLGLLAAVSLFGAVVLWAADIPWPGPAAFLVVAAAGTVLALWRTARTPHVLLVGEPRGRPAYRLREDLDEDGYALRFCPGPAARPCPWFEGKPCPITGRVVAAMVVGEPAGTRHPPCHEALGVPEIARGGRP